ncbi:MAG: hypothetical protein WA892_12790 [Ornithinimicrobium sp.]
MNEALSEPGGLDAQDEQILTEVREIYRRLDPVPATLLDRVKYAMTVRLLEAEVAELTRMPISAVRSEPSDRFDSISFTGSRLSLMVSISPQDRDAGASAHGEDAAVRIDCWVSVAGAVVEVRSSGAEAGQSASQVCDDNGRCVFEHVGAGPAHFIVWSSPAKDSPPTMTPTIDL